MDSGSKVERPIHPRYHANIFSILTFSWTLGLFKTGWKRALQVNDLYTALDEHTSSLLGNKLQKKWRNEIFRAKKANRTPSFLRTLIQMFNTQLLCYGLCLATIEIILKMIQPLLIGGLLAYFDSDESGYVNSSHAYINAISLILCLIASIVFEHFTQIEILHLGMKMRVACCSIVYYKTLRLSKTALGRTTVGHVVNLLSNDVNRFDTGLLYLNYLWIGPLQTIVATYFLWQEVGVSSIFGVSVLFMFIPFQIWLGKKIAGFRLKTAIRTDERVRLMNEIINGMQVIKMYTWEKPFAFLVCCARKKEIEQIKKSSYIKAILVSFRMFHAKIVLFFSIFFYVLLGNFITAKKVFVMISYFNILRTTMTVYFPQGIGQIAEILISIKRLQNFLLCEEKDNMIENVSATDNKKDDSVEIPRLYISNASAKWTDTQEDNSLKNINLTVRPGKLVAIIGPVGAGKSSLIQAILRELPLVEGNISVQGVISYASQEPWIFNSSVQENIVFGSQMDEKRYDKVIEVCALKTDFNQFAYGDKTVVGERGVFLSGGQRARINLARAVYKQADIYLLDDPLSAVDTRVGKHLFETCIKGYLKGKTCILITHQLQYLDDVDEIVLMENAHILAKGTYQELLASGLDLMRLLRISTESNVLSDDESNTKSANSNYLNQYTNVSRRVSLQNIKLNNKENKQNEVKENPNQIAETQSFGHISRSVWSSYFSTGGQTFARIFLLLMFVLTQALSSGVDYWLSFWVNLEELIFHKNVSISSLNNTTTLMNSDGFSDKLLWWSISRQACIIIFAALTLFMILSTLLRSATFILISMKASMNLHNKMFNSIIRATMYFFNTNSSGRILNRFSSDIGAIDEILPVTLMDCMQMGLLLLGILIVVTLVNVSFIIPTFIIGVIFYRLRVFYVSTSRSVKRLEGVTRSPVFTHLNATLQGLTTIRAFEAENILSKEFSNHQDLHSSAWYLFIFSSKAFGFWLDTICLIYITIIIFSFLIVDNVVPGGNVGLAITQAIRLTGMLQWTMRQSAELENQMTSVERVNDYTNVPHEYALDCPPGEKPPKKWPSKGSIVFKNFYLRYSQDTPHVLKNLSINIEPMEKVGIVGRTGAGKSSLIRALFRLAINEGSIIIDDLDINKLGLKELRSKLSIIPQEPVLFSGTMRKNLDPFDEYPDHVLWNVLKEVELKDVVKNLPDGLNSKVSESGSNFSVGQRQLVCLARAIVRNNKILLLDEATANIDLQTDTLIQNTIKNKFRSCTVLTIAHRLSTIMDSDKVIVMDGGSLVEFDRPFNLLKNHNGLFYQLVEQTGQTTTGLLHQIAAESDREKLSMRQNMQ